MIIPEALGRSEIKVKVFYSTSESVIEKANNSKDSFQFSDVKGYLCILYEHN